MFLDQKSAGGHPKQCIHVRREHTVERCDLIELLVANRDVEAAAHTGGLLPAAGTSNVLNQFGDRLRQRFDVELSVIPHGPVDEVPEVVLVEAAAPVGSKPSH